MLPAVLGCKILALGLNFAADFGVPFPACLSLSEADRHVFSPSLSHWCPESGFRLLSYPAYKKHMRPKEKNSWVSSRRKRKK